MKMCNPISMARKKTWNETSDYEALNRERTVQKNTYHNKL